MAILWLVGSLLLITTVRTKPRLFIAPGNLPLPGASISRLCHAPEAQRNAYLGNRFPSQTPATYTPSERIIPRGCNQPKGIRRDAESASFSACLKTAGERRV